MSNIERELRAIRAEVQIGRGIERQTMGLKQAAARMGISSAHLRALITMGAIRTGVVAGKRVIPIETVRGWRGAADVEP